MTELAGGILFLAWTALIVMGMVPSLGARVGLWLRGGSLREPAPPLPPEQKPAEVESHLGKNVDRFV